MRARGAIHRDRILTNGRKNLRLRKGGKGPFKDGSGVLMNVMIVTGKDSSEIRKLNLRVRRFRLVLQVITLCTFPKFLRDLGPFGTRRATIKRASRLPTKEGRTSDHVRRSVRVHFQGVTKSIKRSFGSPLVQMFSAQGRCQCLVERKVATVNRYRRDLVTKNRGRIHFPLPNALTSTTRSRTLKDREPMVNVRVFDDSVNFGSPLIRSILRVFYRGTMPEDVFYVKLCRGCVMHAFHDQGYSQRRPRRTYGR